VGHLRAPARRCGAGARTGSRSGGADAGEDEFVREPALHDLAERYLHPAIEACLDLANHWIADRGLRTPDANRDTFTVLEEAGELSGDLAGRLRGWAGFRNILVHEYLTIDHGMAYRAIRDELGDLETVARWAADRLGNGT
jgi:uncharacterized protein YutE (UPF0331/DUF86 family)